jgi:hypothetical protein
MASSKSLFARRQDQAVVEVLCREANDKRGDSHFDALLLLPVEDFPTTGACMALI